MTSDRELARRMLAGDERAFGEFFDGHFPGLYRFALTRLDRDEAAAEEVAQAALCKAISKLSTWRGEATLFTWLCTFCRHEISAFCQRNRRAPHQVGLVEDLPEVRAALESLPASLREGPGEALDRKELGRLVQVALDRLPPHYGDALEWKYLEGLAVKEIAARLGLSAKAAESLLVRARDAFRDGFAALVQKPPMPESPS
ncbi:MAG TPA: sigma-70 family RNA polymerase sigma factor [Thermoanaerobaculia bacterium]|nr:sigma-70 family RNA polymerase sigma factor [Thermoanaerobaculia bacterium]